MPSGTNPFKCGEPAFFFFLLLLLLLLFFISSTSGAEKLLGINLGAGEHTAGISAYSFLGRRPL